MTSPRYLVAHMVLPAFLRDQGAPHSSPRTVICEWAGSTHSNFGTGPPVTGNLAADCEAFVERVLQVCA